MTIGLCGAAGQLGRLTIRAVKARAAWATLVALVRDPAKAENLGIPARHADHDQPDTLVSAFEGLDTLLLISSNAMGGRVAQHRHVIAAARAAGVRRLIYTSLLRADVSPLSLAEDHRQTEADLHASGMAFTILRNGWYMENYTGSLATSVNAGALLGSAREGRISAATRADYAEAAAVALISRGHDGKTYELAADSAFTLGQLAAEVSRQTGRRIPYLDLAAADYAARLRDRGVPARFADALASWDAAAAQGALYDDGHELSALIGRPTTPLSNAVAQALGTSGADQARREIRPLPVRRPAS
ncbi:MAG: NAD(P)H-binding protein [Alphaproteobacteria bacterium]|nr:NAD(P)H-binding protein [Alphaproteobacteria bacterium]